MASVRLSGVRKVYPNGHEAVKDFSLDIPDGGFAVLVGPSGCGKSTTLRMIAGLEDPTAGSVEIGGRVVNDVAPKDRDIAMVFQNYALYPHMTVYKNMSFALRLRKTPKAEIDRRVRETARLLGIEDLLDRKPRQLSGGQRQRVAVGRAIVREPKAFLFDEPLSNLDAKLRVTTRAELKALHQRLKTTTVYVTHDQEEAMTLGDVIVVMEGGLIRQVGPPLDVYQKPLNRFVASFIGTPPMNFLEGRLSEAGEFLEADGSGLTLPLPAAWRDKVASLLGQRVTLGVRPPQVVPAWLAGAPQGPRVTLHVDVVEPLGDQVDAACRTPAGARLVARVPSLAGVRPGAGAEFILDLERSHLFEPDAFGANLTLEPGR